MFRFLAKSALATVIWKRYRRPIVSTLILFISYFFIAMVHGDYVSWATTTAEHQHLWISFVLKWLALIGVTLLYYWYNSRAIAHIDKQDETEAERHTSKKSRRPQTPPPESDAPDPFAAIRQKDKLRSRADVAMAQHKQNHKP
ncbi:hypothetical protein [Gilvimarinus agarilyticus]|uniref:hypothetical protein n=1 Tax=Gilvimarinus agarilyticus TaxID=679259 RepID=UPI0005A069D4|nr:hypothetical protein [Gilvimarinus agarilyticus]|tara:strand:- start:1185 stop:1613 length:429 start_codon:yes stop_codon:yes gene_type:complete